MSDNYTIGTASSSTIAGDWTTLTSVDGSIDCSTPYYDMSQQPVVSIPSVWPSGWYAPNNKKGDDNMRYLYEVILVNPKDDEFEVFEVVAKTETSALMQAYNNSEFSNKHDELYDKVDFDDLETQCRILMSWERKKSLEKALETIKKAVE